MTTKDYMNGAAPRWVVYLLLAVIGMFGAGMTWLVAEHTRLDEKHVSAKEFKTLQDDVREIRGDVKDLVKELLDKD